MRQRNEEQQLKRLEIVKKNINQPNAQLASSQPVIEMDSTIFKILQNNLKAESLPFTLP